jgi:hypothetical protein
MLSISHLLEYVIEFINPVDLFDVIYRLKIETRNDFKGYQNKIIICSLRDYIDNSTNKNDVKYRFAKTKFIENNAYLWNENYHLVLTNFERKFKDNETEYKEDWIESHGNLDGFYEHYNKIIELSNELEKECDNIQLTQEEINLINHIMNFHDLKSNIKFIGWKDCWICD